MPKKQKQRKSLPVLFQENLQIKMIGAWDTALFRASDLAAKIDDIDYFNALKELLPTDVKMVEEKDSLGRVWEVRYLTENGAYKYLFRKDTEKSNELQSIIFDMLREDYKHVADDIRRRRLLLAAKNAKMTRQMPYQ